MLRRSARPLVARSRWAAAVSVTGELAITAGVLLVLFLVWKLWWNDGIIAAAQTKAADQHSSQWAGLPVGAQRPSVTPIVRPEPHQLGTVIGVLHIPRFGAHYARTIAEGTTDAELSTFTLGVGHYPGTQMPGQVGNFAVAGHRSAYGGAMHLMQDLTPGDRIIVETRDGWYTYRFESRRTVLPTAIGAIDAVPWKPHAVPTERLITLTTCTPLYSTALRYVSVGVFESFRPRVARVAATPGHTAEKAAG